MTAPGAFSARPVGGAAEPCPLARLRVQIRREDGRPLDMPVPVNVTGAKQLAQRFDPANEFVEFGPLQPGSWSVTVPHSGEFVRSYQEVPVHLIELVSAKTTPLEIVLTPLGGFKIRVVRSDTGAIVPNTEVTAARGAVKGAITAGSSGVAGFAGLPRNDYQVTAVLAPDDRGKYEPVQPMQAPAETGPPVQHDLVVIPLANLSVVVKAKVIQNGQTKDRFFPKAKVEVTGPTPTQPLSYDKATGSTTFGFVKAGDYQVRVELAPDDAKEFLPPQLATITLLPGQVRAHEVLLELTDWIEVELFQYDADQRAIPVGGGEKVVITSTADRTKRIEAILDDAGVARIENVKFPEFTISFPAYDGTEFEGTAGRPFNAARPPAEEIPPRKFGAAEIYLTGSAMGIDASSASTRSDAPKLGPQRFVVDRAKLPADLDIHWRLMGPEAVTSATIEAADSAGKIWSKDLAADAIAGGEGTVRWQWNGKDSRGNAMATNDGLTMTLRVKGKGEGIAAGAYTYLHLVQPKRLQALIEME